MGEEQVDAAAVADDFDLGRLFAEGFFQVLDVVEGETVRGSSGGIEFYHDSVFCLGKRTG